MAKQISFNFPNGKLTVSKPIKKIRKTRSDKGLSTCIWCGEKHYDVSEIFLFHRKDSNGNTHHIGYVFDKDRMKEDPLFEKYISTANICEQCQEHQ